MRPWRWSDKRIQRIIVIIIAFFVSYTRHSEIGAQRPLGFWDPLQVLMQSCVFVAVILVVYGSAV